MYNTHITSTSTQKVTSKANIFTLPNELLEPILSYAADATTALELDTIQEHTHIQRWKDIALTCRVSACHNPVSMPYLVRIADKNSNSTKRLERRSVFPLKT